MFGSSFLTVWEFKDAVALLLWNCASKGKFLMSELYLKTTVENCMDIQYILLMIGKGVDMSNKNQNDILLSALEIVIDGVANSEATERTRAAGAYIAGLILADTKGQLDSEKQKAILSIVEMASEVDSTAFIQDSL
ncbi:TPA: hypothetical protein ACPJ2F_001990 [Vibrio diabolicus]